MKDGHPRRSLGPLSNWASIRPPAPSDAMQPSGTSVPVPQCNALQCEQSGKNCGAASLLRNAEVRIPRGWTGTAARVPLVHGHKWHGSHWTRAGRQFPTSTALVVFLLRILFWFWFWSLHHAALGPYAMPSRIDRLSKSQDAHGRCRHLRPGHDKSHRSVGCPFEFICVVECAPGPIYRDSQSKRLYHF